MFDNITHYNIIQNVWNKYINCVQKRNVSELHPILYELQVYFNCWSNSINICVCEMSTVFRISTGGLLCIVFFFVYVNDIELRCMEPFEICV